MPWGNPVFYTVTLENKKTIYSFHVVVDGMFFSCFFFYRENSKSCSFMFWWFTHVIQKAVLYLRLHEELFTISNYSVLFLVMLMFAHEHDRMDHVTLGQIVGEVGRLEGWCLENTTGKTTFFARISFFWKHKHSVQLKKYFCCQQQTVR